VVTITRRPALAADHTSSVTFRALMSMIRWSDLNGRPKLFLSHSLSICSNLVDDGKLGYGFTSANELEEIDIGPGDKPQPTFISKKLDPSLRETMIALLKEYSDCFAWNYTELPRLDRGIIEHQLPLKKGFRPYQQRAHQMRTEV
jgi:hypothetical protein